MICNIFKRSIICFIIFIAGFFQPDLIAQVINNESFNTTPFPSGGWSNSGTTSLWVQRTTGTNPTCTPHSGAAMARFSSNAQPAGTTDYFYSPVVDLSNTQGATPTFSIWVYREASSTAGDSISVMINTSASATGAVRIGGVARSRFYVLPNSETADGWYQYSFNVPPAFNSSTNYFILRGVARGGGNIYIDDVSWTSFPTPCSGMPSPGAVSSSQSTICGGTGSVNLNLNNSSTGLGISYQWESGPSVSGPWTAFGLNEPTASSGTITSTTWFRCVVTCTNSLMSDTTAAIEVIVIPGAAPNVTVTPNNNLNYCINGTPLTLVASGAATYTWIPNIAIANGVGDSALAAPATNTTYTIVGTTSGGCVDTAIVNVQVRTPPAVNGITNNATICAGDSTNLQAFIQGPGGFGSQYIWTPGPLNGANQIVAPSITTSYVVSVTSQQTGCTGRDTVVINVSQHNVAGFNYVLVNGSDFYFSNTSTGSITYNWNFGDGSSDTSANPVHTYAIPGVYTVTLIAGNGVCPNDTLTQQVTVVVIGMNENAALSVLPVYPNPAQSFISFGAGILQPHALITVSDAMGRILIQKEATNFQSDGKQILVPVASFPSGAYTISAISENKLLSNRFIVIK